MAGNAVTLEFAGDAAKLQRAGREASQAVETVSDSVSTASEEFKRGSDESTNFLTRVGKLGAGVSGMTDAIDTAGGAVQALSDLQQAGAEQASRLGRALNDVEQAQEDYNQALRDGAQAAIDSDQAEVDLEQARLDQATALKDYNKAVREHGAASDEAKQAQIDLKQAGVDVKQAQEDAAQAVRDASQANIDAKSAQLDLNDAMREAHPPELQVWADKIQLVTPLLSAVVGVIGLVTAAQWLWNTALFASPITWIVLAIVALVAIIVIIATKTTWFQDIWKATWGGIKRAAEAVGKWFRDVLWGQLIRGAWRSIQLQGEMVWNWMKALPGRIRSAFYAVSNFISAPFRGAFNMISSAWNNTIGRLSWTVPGWVPGVGGNSISAPQLPHFHKGGTVPGVPGQEVLAVLQAGETVSPAGASTVIEIRSGGTNLDDALVEILARAIRRRGGNVQLALGGRNA